MLFTLAKGTSTLLLLVLLVATASAAPQRLRWRRNTINIGISTSLLSAGPNMPTKPETLTAIERAFQAWEDATNINFRSTTSPLQSVDPPGPEGDGVSLVTIAATRENEELFPRGIDDAAARTRVFYDAKGFVTEADIVLNPFQQFSVDGNLGTFDLQATLTHELGHLLGLGHSDVLGATMGDNNAKNGVYGLTGYSPRTLSASDLAAIRSLYGAPVSDSKCCSKIAGKLTINDGKPASAWMVWAEEMATGRVAAATRSGSDGTFLLDGLESVDVRVFAQPVGKALNVAYVSLGEFALQPGSVQQISRDVEVHPLDLTISFVGSNDQLAGSAVNLNAGFVYEIYVAGEGLTPENISVVSSSPWLTINQEMVTAANFGEGVSALSFRVNIPGGAPIGDYSIFVKTGTGEGRALVGSLTVEKFPNISTKGIAAN